MGRSKDGGRSGGKDDRGGGGSRDGLALELEPGFDNIDWVSKDDGDHAAESAKEQFCSQFLSRCPYVC